MTSRITILLILLNYFSMIYGEKGKVNFFKQSEDQNDTIVVYDTVFVYDTIKISNNLLPTDENFFSGKMKIKSTVLQIDTSKLNANIVLFTENSAATIPINRIIINRNINSKQKMYNMKKIGFFGLVFLAFQSTVLPQSDYGLTAGIGTWWATSNKSYIKSVFSPALQAGFFLDKQVATSNLFIKTGLNFHFLLSNYSYKNELDSVQGGTWGDGESASNYYQLSIPVGIGYSIGRFQPYAGVEYAFRLSDAWLGKKINYLGVNAGISYAVSKKINFSLTYSHGLTNDYNVKINETDPLTMQPSGIIKTFSWKSSYIGLNVYYNLGKSTKKE